MNIRKLLLGFLYTFLVIFAALFLWNRFWNTTFILTPYHRLEGTGKVVALTFDDGPSKEKTPGVLDILAKHRIKATFFLVGQRIEAHRDIAARILREGHLIGNHTYSHMRMYFRTPDQTRNEILKTDRLIQELGQKDVRYFRPPFNSRFIVLPLVLKDLGKTLVTGTYDPPAEFQKPFNPELVTAQILENVTPGCIIYLHDGTERDPGAFLDSLEKTIEGLKAQGYSFARLD